MSTTTQDDARFAWCVAALAAVTFAATTTVAPGHPPRFMVTSAASALVDQELAAAAPTDPASEGFEGVPPPGIRFVASDAQATSAPWIDSNGWRFQRGLERAHYARLPAGSAPRAAAEAFAFGAYAILNPDPADVDQLGAMLRFLNAEAKPRLPVMANIGVVHDRSRQMEEVLNLLTRRNLLYRMVAEADPSLDLTVELGTERFPREAADDPYEFAARVRAELGDDKRLVRIFGSSTLIVHLTGDHERARLYVLDYAREEDRFQPQPVRIRLRGLYQPTHVGAFRGAPDARLTDVDHPGDSTEFFLPDFRIIAIVDLER
jgi:hypothetical protein